MLDEFSESLMVLSWQTLRTDKNQNLNAETSAQNQKQFMLWTK